MKIISQSTLNAHRDVFHHIRSKYDRDPFANTYIRCRSCGTWDNAMYGNSCCPYCGADYAGNEDTQRGVCPPGWEN